MPNFLKQLVEAIFTAYLLPALLVPLVWLIRAIRGNRADRSPGRFGPLRRVQGAYASVAILITLLWAAAKAGLRVELGGRPITVVAWILFGTLNFLFAVLAVRMAGDYARLPDGRPKDALFLRFLAAIVAQPLVTLAAFSLLYRLLRVVYHRQFPWLNAVQEGI